MISLPTGKNMERKWNKRGGDGLMRENQEALKAVSLVGMDE